MPELVHLDFQITGPGWAKCSVRLGPSAIEIGPFSHALSDGFDDLVRSTLLIVTGCWRTNFSMDDEPEPRWVWSLEQTQQYHPYRLELLITITLADMGGELGAVVLREICDPDDFARAVLAMSKALVAKAEPSGSLEKWGPLPIRAIAALEAALETRHAVGP